MADQSCQPSEPMKNLTLEQWQLIDEALFATHPVHAVAVICQSLDFGTAAALEAVYERYHQLRAEQPGRFTPSEDAYWDGFYT
jgi:hypothetical protein